MRPRFNLDGLKKPKAWEYVVRFVFGGLVTAIAGLIAHAFGPVVGGLFLTLPAILPASLTLVKQHDGRTKAADDARGARLGGIALAAFGTCVWLNATTWPAPIVLLAATLLWVATAVGLWMLEYGKTARP